MGCIGGPFLTCAVGKVGAEFAVFRLIAFAIVVVHARVVTWCPKTHRMLTKQRFTKSMDARSIVSLGTPPPVDAGMV